MEGFEFQTTGSLHERICGSAGRKEPGYRCASGLRLPLASVIASEAKQSMAPSKEGMDCFVAFAPRNDVAGIFVRISRTAVNPTAAPQFGTARFVIAGAFALTITPRSRLSAAFSAASLAMTRRVSNFSNVNGALG
ncbi:hypothetical protein KIP88_41080 [Bradyrhizobium sp. SRL28]|uniref:hypothetical protein n=1 Tax=Bradyrhizobium sp. SRL28 TaxID=2836178 RepID=UPI001BDF63FE|nr:hypothetical protein [Bradyrhizobium sp. SRL28]MBT1516802.1 hypothetical protein [Bradyrhizobium sp. SRL28]